MKRDVWAGGWQQRLLKLRDAWRTKSTITATNRLIMLQTNAWQITKEIPQIQTHSKCDSKSPPVHSYRWFPYDGIFSPPKEVSFYELWEKCPRISKEIRIFSVKRALKPTNWVVTHFNWWNAISTQPPKPFLPSHKWFYLIKLVFTIHS